MGKAAEDHFENRTPLIDQPFEEVNWSDQGAIDEAIALKQHQYDELRYVENVLDNRHMLYSYYPMIAGTCVTMFFGALTI